MLNDSSCSHVEMSLLMAGLHFRLVYDAGFLCRSDVHKSCQRRRDFNCPGRCWESLSKMHTAHWVLFEWFMLGGGLGKHPNVRIIRMERLWGQRQGQILAAHKPCRGAGWGAWWRWKSDWPSDISEKVHDICPLHPPFRKWPVTYFTYRHRHKSRTLCFNRCHWLNLWPCQQGDLNVLKCGQGYLLIYSQDPWPYIKYTLSNIPLKL